MSSTNLKPANLREWITKYAASATSLCMGGKTCYIKRKGKPMMPVPHREVNRSRTIRDRAANPRDTDPSGPNDGQQLSQPS